MATVLDWRTRCSCCRNICKEVFQWVDSEMERDSVRDWTASSLLYSWCHCTLPCNSHHAVSRREQLTVVAAKNLSERRTRRDLTPKTLCVFCFSLRAQWQRGSCWSKISLSAVWVWKICKSLPVAPHDAAYYSLIIYSIRGYSATMTDLCKSC